MIKMDFDILTFKGGRIMDNQGQKKQWKKMTYVSIGLILSIMIVFSLGVVRKKCGLLPLRVLAEGIKKMEEENEQADN